MPEIVISESNLLEIMAEIGFPILEFDDDFPYTADQVKSLAIWPAMKSYFRHWPIRNVKEYAVSGNFSLDFPSEKVFNILDARLNTNVPIGSNTGDPFVNMMNITQIGGSRNGMYGTRYNYDITTAYHMSRAEKNAMINSQSAFRVFVNEPLRKLEGYTNSTGKITVTWAEYDFDYDKIAFSKIDEVRDLAKAYLMRIMGNFFSLQTSDNVNSVDAGFLLDRAEELEKEILDRWNNIVTPVIIRN